MTIIEGTHLLAAIIFSLNEGETIFEPFYRLISEKYALALLQSLITMRPRVFIVVFVAPKALGAKFTIFTELNDGNFDTGYNKLYPFQLPSIRE